MPGPRPPNRTPCRIDRIITKNIQFLEPQMKKNGYIIKTTFADELPEIMADGDMLYQAFLNLLINGMQAMPDGGAIKVSIEKQDKALWVSIEDEGGRCAASGHGKGLGSFFYHQGKRDWTGIGHC